VISTFDWLLLDDVGQLRRREERVDASEVEPRALAGAAALDVAGVVLHEDGVMVEAVQRSRAQEMGEAIGARLELGVGDRLAALRHDEGRLISTRDRVSTRIHRMLPKDVLRRAYARPNGQSHARRIVVC
jgi:hypothetical protein